MKLKAWLPLIAVYIIWGSTYLAIRFAVETIPPFLMAATRMLTAGTILFTILRATGAPRPTLAQWKAAGVVGLFLLTGSNGLVGWAEQRVVSNVAALIIGATPLWIVLIDALRPGGERPSFQVALGVLIGFAGVIILINPFNSGDSPDRVDLIGAAALLMASLLWATGSIYGREHHREMPAHPLMAAGMQMLVGGSGLLIVGTLSGEWGRLNLAAITRESGLALAYLIVFGSIVAYASYSWLLGNAPTPLVATYAYVNPLVAVLLGRLLANEPISPRFLFSAAFIIGAVVLINTVRFVQASNQRRAVRLSAQGAEADCE